MTIKERIENNPVAWLLGTLLAGFLAGISSYQAILSMSQLDVVRNDSYVKIDEFRSLKSSIDTLKLNNDCNPLIIDLEKSLYDYSTSKNYSFNLRFFNTTNKKLNCLIRLKSGYCKDKSDTETWSEPSEGFTMRATKDYSFIIESLQSYNLKGTIEQFPESVSENNSLFYEVVKTSIIE